MRIKSMEFKALHIPTLTKETATKLEDALDGLVGIEQFTINVGAKEMRIIFNESQLSFRALIQKMTEAGCSLQHIDAALLL